jgi:hypothetical protein
MADDKSRSTIATAAVLPENKTTRSNFAKRHNISVERARDLIAKYGNDREKLDREASKPA